MEKSFEHAELRATRQVVGRRSFADSPNTREIEPSSWCAATEQVSEPPESGNCGEQQTEVFPAATCERVRTEVEKWTDVDARLRVVRRRRMVSLLLRAATV